MKAKRLKCLENNYPIVIFYLIFISIFNHGFSTRAGNIRILFELGSFEIISGHHCEIRYEKLGYLNVYPLRLLLAHDLLSTLGWYDSILFYKAQYRQIRGRMHLGFFDHNLNRIIRMGGLFENHPT